MTNRQWLMNEMQNMSDEKLCDFDVGKMICDMLEVDACKEVQSDCRLCKTNWLKLEHKEIPKLSDAERVILENIDTVYNWIARDSEGLLRLYGEKPKKYSATWGGTNPYCPFWAFDNLFQFVKWSDEEPYNIEELLKESQKGNANKYLTIEGIKALYEEMDNNREAGDSYFTKYDGTQIPLDTGYAFEGIKLFIEEIEHKLKGGIT